MKEEKHFDAVWIGFDFDGVICDSARETAWSGWLAATSLCAELKDSVPPSEYLSFFCQVRPWLETGYESILIALGWKEGVSLEDFVSNYTEMIHKLLESYQLTKEFLIDHFAATRINWINRNRREWLETHQFYPWVQWLKGCRYPWFILSTKQEIFLKELCRFGGIPITEDRIFGLERGKKEEVLSVFLKRDVQLLCFIEDRMETLDRVGERISDNRIRLLLATWGYLSREDWEKLEKSANIFAIRQEEMKIFLENPCSYFQKLH